MKGTLFLIPSDFGEHSNDGLIPEHNKDIISFIDVLLAEKPKTTRAFIKRLNLKKSIQEIVIYPYSKKSREEDIKDYLDMLLEGKNLGIVPEVGCPGIADPGAKLVALAHKSDIKVVPLVGPSSIMMALMASGLNGQNFEFVGYIPRKKEERSREIQKMAEEVERTGKTMVFIETPYRNQYVFEDLVRVLPESLKLCVAVDISTKSESIRTMNVSEWRDTLKTVHLNDKQVVFLIG